MADEVALASEAEFEGGVRSWVTLTGGGMAWDVLMPDKGGNFWLDIMGLNCRAVGGGSSRLKVACLRWLRPEGVLRASRDVPIGRGIATEARVTAGQVQCAIARVDWYTRSFWLDPRPVITLSFFWCSCWREWDVVQALFVSKKHACLSVAHGRCAFLAASRLERVAEPDGRVQL